MSRFFKWIIFLSILGSLITLAYGTHLTLKYIKMNRDVIIEHSLTDSIEHGIPFELTTRIENKGTAPLKDAQIVFTLGKALVNYDANKENELRTISLRLGDIISDSSTIVSTTLIAIDTQSEDAKVTAVLRYLNESGTRYETEHPLDLQVKDRETLRVNITTPNEIISGSLIDIDITYENQSDTDYRNVSLEVNYPDEFRYVSANLPPENKRNIWDLGEVPGNGKGTIRIRGIFEGNGSNTFHVETATNLVLAGRAFPLSRNNSKSSATRTPIEIEISTANNIGKTVKSGEKVDYLVRIRNTSGVPLLNATAKLTLSGAYQYPTLETSGRVNTASNSIVYDSEILPELLSWSSGAVTELKLSSRTKAPAELLETSDRDKKIKLSVEVTSETVPDYIKADQTRQLSTNELLVTDGIVIDARGFHRDPSVNVSLAGPFPPQVGKPTDYTIHWIIKNYGSDIIGAEVAGQLADGVEWKDSLWSSNGTGLKYDSASKRVIWNINRVSASDVSGQTEAVFQITATPEIENIGNHLLLLQKTVLDGTEEASGKQVRSEDGVITTQLTDDPTVGKNDGRVVL